MTVTHVYGIRSSTGALRTPCGLKQEKNHLKLTRQPKHVTCVTCLVAVDALLEAGVLRVCEGCARQGLFGIDVHPRYEATSSGASMRATAQQVLAPFWAVVRKPLEEA